jgi:hypothetical protein
MNLKISVLSSGDILLDGEPTGLANLAEAIQKAEPSTDYVLYYRENAAAEPPPVSKDVIDLVIAKKLAVSFSTKADFSDCVEPRPELIFERARQVGVAIITRSGQIASVPLPAASARMNAMARTLPKMFASEGSHNLAVIADTGSVPEGQASVDVQETAKAIPFLGLLVGLGYAGHKVWTFSGASFLLKMGLAESDALLVDSTMLPSLPEGWMQTAQRAMRKDSRIYLHDRESSKLRRIVPSMSEPGWRDCEPEGERSYANCLLTTLANGPSASVVLASGSAVPDLAGLTQDPEELDWIAGLPFRYDRLDAVAVIANLVGLSGGAVNLARSEWSFSPMLASAKGNRKVDFGFRWLSRFPKQSLEITRK